MSAYLEFLSRWYNLAWLAAVAAGALLIVAGRRRTVFSPAAAAVAAGVAGLTLNGAIHDLRLGPIGPRFPLVALLSLAVGLVVGWFGPRLRDRIAPPVTGVTFNRRGLEGLDVVVLSARLGGDGADIGRARHRDEDGVSHIVRIRLDPGAPEDTTLRFGARVRLGSFDAERRAYRVRPDEET